MISKTAVRSASRFRTGKNFLSIALLLLLFSCSVANYVHAESLSESGGLRRLEKAPAHSDKGHGSDGSSEKKPEEHKGHHHSHNKPNPMAAPVPHVEPTGPPPPPPPEYDTFYEHPRPKKPEPKKEEPMETSIKGSSLEKGYDEIAPSSPSDSKPHEYSAVDGTITAPTHANPAHAPKAPPKRGEPAYIYEKGSKAELEDGQILLTPDN